MLCDKIVVKSSTVIVLKTFTSEPVKVNETGRFTTEILYKLGSYPR